MLQNKDHLSGKRIGIFGKGGAGKSTVTVLLAQTLAHRGYDVLVLDADSTNVGLHEALGIEAEPAPLLEYFGGAVFSGGAVTCPVDDPTRLPNATLPLSALPDRYVARNENGIVFLTAGKIGEQGPGAGCDGPVAKIARDLHVTEVGERPVTLIDFKAGFEDSARGAITSLDLALVVVDPTQAAIHMAANMKAMIDEMQRGVLPATRHLEDLDMVALANHLFTTSTIQGALVVLNRVDSAATEAYLREALAERGLEPIGVLHRHPAVGAAWLRGSTLDDGALLQEVAVIADNVEAVAARQSSRAEAGA